MCLKELVDSVEDIPEGGDDFRGLGVLYDVATEHEAVNGGTDLADPGQHVVETAASRTPQQQDRYRRVLGDLR